MDGHFHYSGARNVIATFLSWDLRGLRCRYPTAQVAVSSQFTNAGIWTMEELLKIAVMMWSVYPLTSHPGVYPSIVSRSSPDVHSPIPGRLGCVNIRTLITPMKMAPVDISPTIVIHLSVHCICVFVYEINYEINSFKRLIQMGCIKSIIWMHTELMLYLLFILQKLS